MKNLYLILFLVIFKATFAQNSFETIESNNSLTNEIKSKKFDSLLRRYKQKNEIDSLISVTYKIFKWQSEKNNNLKRAIDLNKQNLELIQSKNFNDELLFRKNVYSLGFYESENKEIKTALKRLKTLLNYKEPDKYSLNSAFTIAEIYYDEGDYYKSLEYFKLSRLLAEKFKDHSMYAATSERVGKTSLRINTDKSLKEGIDEVTKTLAYIENLPPNSINIYYELNLYKLLGNLYSDREDYNFENAITYLNKALGIAKSINDEIELRNINNDLGLIYLKDSGPEAENYFKTALTYWTDNIMYAVIHKNLAQFYFDTDAYEKSLRHIQNAIEALNLKRTATIEELPEKEKLKTAKTKSRILSALVFKASVWIKLSELNDDKSYYYEQANKTVELGDWLIDIARLSDLDYKSKLFWRKKAADLYLTAIELCSKLNQPEKAFYYFEKNKALQLLEDINLKSLRETTKIPESITENEQRLKERIINLEKQQSTSPTEAISKELIVAKENYDVFINGLDSEIKLLYKLEKPIEVINYDEFKQNYLSKENVYLEYIHDNESGFGLLISKNHLNLFDITDPEELKSLAKAYRNLLNAPISNEEDLKKFNSTSYKLYNKLIPQTIRKQIRNKIITIIPDNYLQNIPFETLTTSNKDPNSYLIFQNEINYSYSISFLIKNSELKQENNNSMVAFAPVDFKDNFTSLPNTRQELELISELNTVNSFLNENASKSNFFKNSKDAKVIHIASHANASDSISPWISFQDEKLYLNELFNHDTAADLVVLSACNTSLGEVYTGEGVMSLARGFFYSGSQSVLTSLWTVNDKSTSFIMKDFYKNLNAGKTKSKALHNAKLKYIESHSLSEASPYYWSSFVLLGDANLLDENIKLEIWHYLAIGLVLLIFFFVVKKNKFFG